MKYQNENEFLQKYWLKKLTYAQTQDILWKENLFGYWDEYIWEESEESVDEWYDDWNNIYYYEGDLTFDGDATIQDIYYYTLVVKWNLTVNWIMKQGYYITGNGYFDALEMKSNQVCIGKETVKYFQSQYSEDDWSLKISKKRTVTAPYFFSWFYDLNAYDFVNSETVIFALYDYYKLKLFQTNLSFFKWHEAFFVIKTNLYWQVEEDWHNNFSFDFEQIYEILKKELSIFIDDFDVSCKWLYDTALKFFDEKNYPLAYYYAKQSYLKSPNYFPASFLVAESLRLFWAYEQSLPYYQKSIISYPEWILYNNYKSQEMISWSFIRLNKPKEALNIIQDVIKKDLNNEMALRIRWEIYILMNNLDLAKEDLLKSIEIDSFFSNNWLLWLVYFLEGDTKKAEYYYKISANYYSNATPYNNQRSLSFQYPSPISVNWESCSLEQLQNIEDWKEKDFQYWEKYLLENFNSNDWEEKMIEVLNKIPEEFRTKEMCLKLLLDDKIPWSIIQAFFHILDDEILLQSFSRTQVIPLGKIPLYFLSKNIILQYNHSFSIEEIPQELVDYDIALHSVICNYYNYDYIPENFKDDKMLIASIAWWAMDQYNDVIIPKEKQTISNICNAIDLSIKALEKINPRYITKDVYQYAKLKYESHPKWKEIVSVHDRDYWKQSWSDDKTPYNYDTFDHVWACFWDEKYILNCIYKWWERIFNLPEEFFTYKIALAWVETYSYSFSSVPKKYITQELCETACSKDYGSALEFVPIDMRTEKVCLLSVNRDGENLKFVPLALRNLSLCELALKRSKESIKAIPYEFYTEILNDKNIQELNEKYYLGFLYLQKWIGFLSQNKYQEAIDLFEKIRKLDEDEVTSEHIQQSLYFEWFIYYKLENQQKADEFYKKATSQDSNFIQPYKTYNLPKIEVAVWTFDKNVFEDIIWKSQQMIKVKHYDQALEEIEKAEKILINSQTTEMNFWAIIWDQKRYVLIELNQVEKSIEISKNAIEKLSQTTIMPYNSFDNNIRSALRNMYNLLAYDFMQKWDINQSIKYIEKTFETISPIEDDEVLYPFYETKAFIYKKASLIDEKYKKKLEFLLKKIIEIKENYPEYFTNDFDTEFLQ